jgi:type IV pilus assembly protein PilY1
MRTAKALLLSSVLALVALNPAWADDMDIFGANIRPNVMILIDSSQSMSDSVTSIPYDNNLNPGYPVVNRCTSTRTAPCTTQVVWRRTSSSPLTYTKYADTISQVSSSSARTSLTNGGFWSGSIGGSNVNLFVGNYLNYQLGICAVQACTEPKITIAKRAITNLITNTEGVRFGTMKFKVGGGQVINPVGTDVATLVNGVNAMTLTSVGTLTGEQIRDAGLYYKGQFGFPSPIELACQPNFVIVVSDGLYTGINPRPEGTKLFSGPPPINDHAGSFQGIQNVRVHTVGFALPPGDINAGGLVALQDTARNGGGSFYTADNHAQLEAALQAAISEIMGSVFTFAAPVLPTTSTTGSTKAYLAAFQSDPARPFWQGFLKAFQRGADGLVPVDPQTGVPLASALVWEAGQKLSVKDADSRAIYTAIGGTRYNFDKTNASITAAMLGAVSATERDKIIDFIRGIDAYDDDVDANVTEQRAWKLGDIFHSTPVLVTPPTLALADPTYTAFKQNNATRTVILIAGSNDGMIHAFRESDGEELWAFIPPDLLGRLKELTPRTGDHPFYVDSSPLVVDIKISGAWRTVVVFGLRRGGRHYYALDITDTTNPTYLWSFTDAKMGETWSEPAFGKVKLGGVDTFVAFVGGGYDTGENNTTGKAFFVIDLATGTKLWEYFNNGSADDQQYMNFSLAANATAADLNNDSLVDKVYIGDVGGQMWKFDVSANSTAEWRGQRLFAAAAAQSNPPAPGEFYPAQGIYGAPSLALDDSLQLWVFFGTGDRNHPNNVASNRFYGFKDTSNMTNGDPLEEAELVDATGPGVSAGTIAAAPGWFIPLAANEKVLASANVFNKVVLFSTFTPDDPSTPTTCESGGGAAKLYAVQMETGFAAIDFSTGEALTTTSSTATRFITIGTGIASMPVIVMTHSGATVATSVVTATTSEQLPNNPVPPPPFLKRFLFWRELMGS